MSCRNNVFHFYEVFKVSNFFSFVYFCLFAILGFIFLTICLLADNGKISGNVNFWISSDPYIYAICFYISLINLLHFSVFTFIKVKYNIKSDISNINFARMLRIVIIFTDVFYLMLNDFMVRRYLGEIIYAQDYSNMNKW